VFEWRKQRAPHADARVSRPNNTNKRGLAAPLRSLRGGVPLRSSIIIIHNIMVHEQWAREEFRKFISKHRPRVKYTLLLNRPWQQLLTRGEYAFRTPPDPYAPRRCSELIEFSSAEVSPDTEVIFVARNAFLSLVRVFGFSFPCVFVSTRPRKPHFSQTN